MSKPQHPAPACQTKKPGWKDLPLGAVVTSPGNSADYATGNWTRRTTCWIAANCINCNLCWPVCPHDAIRLDASGNMAGVDENKCTACKICIDACPTDPKSLEEREKKM